MELGAKKRTRRSAPRGHGSRRMFVATLYAHGQLSLSTFFQWPHLNSTRDMAGVLSFALIHSSIPSSSVFCPRPFHLKTAVLPPVPPSKRRFAFNNLSLYRTPPEITPGRPRHNRKTTALYRYAIWSTRRETHRRRREQNSG